MGKESKVAAFERSVKARQADKREPKQLENRSVTASGAAAAIIRREQAKGNGR